jgi:hypothetical protein
MLKSKVPMQRTCVMFLYDESRFRTAPRAGAVVAHGLRCLGRIPLGPVGRQRALWIASCSP